MDEVKNDKLLGLNKMNKDYLTKFGTFFSIDKFIKKNDLNN